MILTKKLLGACLIASKETIRPALASVKIDDKKAVATDGYRLIVLDMTTGIKQEDIPSSEYKPLENDSHLLNADDLKKVLATIPNKGSLPVLKTAWTSKGDYDHTVKIVSTDLDTWTTVDLQEVQADYPDYQKVLDNLEEKPVTQKVRVSAKLLKGLLEAFIKSGSQDYVELELRGEMDALKVKGKDHDQKEIVGILMPVRPE